MFIGHCGLAFAAKRVAPTVSLGTLLGAALLADLLFPLLVLARAESFQIRIGATEVLPLEFLNFPYSHSLLALAFWGVIIAGLRAAFVRSGFLASFVLLGLVVSHWVLDVIAHAPDMPVSPLSERGLGLWLWGSLDGTLLVEGALLAAGVAIYARTTWGINRTGTIGLWLLPAAMVAAFLAVIFGPVPQSHAAVLWGAVALWLFVLAAYSVDANRTVSLRRDTRTSPDTARGASSSHVRRKRATKRAGHVRRI
jgi:hypothetical protein